MAPITKDTDSLTGTREGTGRSANIPTPSPEAALKHQPVALEIPVTVNGARAIEGSDKREPFSETTKTVLVFGSGAVIRLNSTVAPGQLLFLTNEQTRKEVVCQVVKSKNYRSVSGYVELEFTETAVGFWGMRFPADRIGSGPQPGTAAVRPAAGNGTVPPPPRPAAPRVEAPVAKQPSGNVAAKPPAAAPITKNVEPRRAVPPTTLASETPLVEPWRKKTGPILQAPATPPSTRPSAQQSAPKHSVSSSPEFDLPHVPDEPASLLTQQPAKAEPLNAAPAFELEPVMEQTPTPRHKAPTQAPTITDSETEELRQHTARLQEQLASMQFVETPGGTPAKPPARANDVVHKTTAHHEPRKSTAPPPEPLEQQIPTWLAPLSGRTATPASTEELIQREKARHRAEMPAHSVPEQIAKPVAPEMSAESVLPDELTEAPVMEEAADSVLPDELTEAPVMEEAADSVLPDELTEAPVMEEAADSVLPDELTEPAGSVVEEQVVEQPASQFEAEVPAQEEESFEEGDSGKSKGLLFGVVAAVVLLAVGGGWWLMKQRSNARASLAVVTPPVVSVAPQTTQGNATKEVPGGTIVTEQENPATSPTRPLTPRERGKNRQVPTLSTEQATPNARPSGTATETTAPETSQDDPKKSMGDIRFQAPSVAKKRNEPSTAGTDAGVSVSETPPATSSESLGSGLGVANNQPAPPSVAAAAAPAPAPASASAAVGGDVKQAKLISSVPPVYPSLARSQHVSGNVVIDALIDANGKVTSMKIMSGPTLLQEAAKDALRQWKYRPATLDGKPVPMHLTVTVQFRLQQ